MQYSMKQEAVTLAFKDFRVIPCNGKKPMLSKWTTKATNNIDAVKKLWGDNNYNIAILTGNSGGNFIVIDCDKKEDNDGVKNFYDYLKKNNITLPKTLSVTTGGGGKHFYFRTNASIKNSTSKHITGVDIRGNGGCVIAPPSLHPSGNRYLWDNNMPMALLPKPLEELFTREKVKEDKKALSKEKKEVIVPTIKDYKNVLVIKEGERNNILFRVTSKLTEIGLSYESILKAIECENDLRCETPLSLEEVKLIVDSGYKYKKENDKMMLSASKIFNGNYNTTSIAIYWLIWYLSLYLCQNKVYITQKEIAKRLGIKTTRAIRNNMKPLIDDKLVDAVHTRNKNGGYGVYSYQVL